MLYVIASGMDNQEEELGSGGGGGVLVGLAGLGGALPWRCLSPAGGRDQEPLPIWAQQHRFPFPASIVAGEGPLGSLAPAAARLQ